MMSTTITRYFIFNKSKLKRLMYLSDTCPFDQNQFVHDQLRMIGARLHFEELSKIIKNKI